MHYFSIYYLNGDPHLIPTSVKSGPWLPSNDGILNVTVTVSATAVTAVTAVTIRNNRGWCDFAAV